jgi:hypothetical protein
VKLEALIREASTSGLKMYGADGDRLPLPPVAGGAAAADAADAADGEPAAEESDADSVCSLIGDDESHDKDC